jgi:hypothetical protein
MAREHYEGSCAAWKSSSSISNEKLEHMDGLESMGVFTRNISRGQRSWSVVFALLLVLGVLPSTFGYTYAFTFSGLTYRVDANNRAWVLGEDYESLGIYIPSVVSQLPPPTTEKLQVIGILARAFSNCSKLGLLDMSDSIRSIGFGAFMGCRSLESVRLSAKITEIFPSTFSGCASLSSISIPDRVTTIGQNAFYGCSSLTSVVIPDGVTSIGKNAFYGCSSLTSVVIGDSVISIRESAFSGCSSLTSIYIWGTPPKVVLEGAFGSVPGTVYYIFGTAGWGAEFGGLPTAVWTSEVTFVGNGGTPSLSEQIYNAGVAYTELPTANRPDFNFTGWWTAAEEGSKVDTTTLVPLLTSGHTLYAQWEVPPGFFSVKFEWGVHGIRTGGG